MQFAGKNGLNRSRFATAKPTVESPESKGVAVFKGAKIILSSLTKMNCDYKKNNDALCQYHIMMI